MGLIPIEMLNILQYYLDHLHLDQVLYDFPIQMDHKTIYAHLNVDGHFLNIDVILASTETLEHWYLLLWKDWITERKTMLGIAGNDNDDIIQRYKDNTDNKPDTLDEQLSALTSVGFKDVDCYYKYGIFTMYGGKK